MQNHFLAKDLKRWRFRSFKGSLGDRLVLFRHIWYILLAFVLSNKTELVFSQPPSYPSYFGIVTFYTMSFLLIYFITSNLHSTMRNNPILNPEGLFNSNVLKTMKQQVLRQAYEQELNKKTERTTNATNVELSERDSAKSIIGSRSLGDLTKPSRVRTGGKHSLHLDRIEPQSLQKNPSSKRSLMQQSDLLNNLERYQSFQLERQRSIREQYKQHLQQQIKRKQSQKEINKITEKEEERSKLNRQESIRNKQSSFKEFYDNANKFRDNAAQGYLQYVSKSKQKEEKDRERERMDLQRSRNQMKVQLLEQFKVKREKRQQLKRSLQQQIVQSQHYRLQEKNQFKNRGYIKYQTPHYNPIYNPIDYKMDLNNKYVLNELIQRSQP